MELARLFERLSHRNQVERGQACGQAEDPPNLLVIEGADRNPSQVQCDRLKQHILSGVARLEDDISLGSIPVSTGRLLVVSRHHQNQGRLFHELLIEGRPAKRAPQVIRGSLAQAVTEGFVMKEPLGQDGVDLQWIEGARRGRGAQLPPAGDSLSRPEKL